MSRTELVVHPRFIESAAGLEKTQQTRLWKQLAHLVKNPDHPSLHRKTVQGAKERLWEFRVDDSYRVIYEERSDQIPRLLLVANHDEALRFAEGWTQPGADVTFGYRPVRFKAELPLQLDLDELRSAVESYKYGPLTAFLKVQPGPEIRLTFGKIEEVLGEDLPDSARKYRAWWGNNENRHVQARAWLSAGRHVSAVSLSERWVIFSS
jgi:mRNA-degrading endonuclease RelE of RelBE toxin-antitoxin system